MSAISPRQLRLMHVARKNLQLPDETYRTALAQVAGVESATDLDQDGFTAIMGLFEHLGFRPTVPQGTDYGPRPGMASFAQLELICVLWNEYTRGVYDSEGQLNKWLLRTHSVSSLRFLTRDQARKAIVGLKAMKKRAA